MPASPPLGEAVSWRNRRPAHARPGKSGLVSMAVRAITSVIALKAGSFVSHHSRVACRRLRHTPVAGVTRGHAQAVLAPGRPPFDLPAGLVARCRCKAVRAATGDDGGRFPLLRPSPGRGAR